VQFVGPLPAELQDWFVNTAGVTAKQPDAAKALIKHLTTPEAAAVIRAKGMAPRSVMTLGIAPFKRQRSA
jgi:molybdate transport system substrate-binding protein